MSHFNLPPSDNINALPSTATARNLGLVVLAGLPAALVIGACSSAQTPPVQTAECTGIAPAIADDGSLTLTHQTRNIPDLKKRYTFELRQEGSNATPIRDTEEGPEEDFTKNEDGLTSGRYTAQGAVEFPGSGRPSVLCKTVLFTFGAEGVSNIVNGNTTPTTFVAPSQPKDPKKDKTAARVTTTLPTTIAPTTTTTTTTVPKPPVTTSTTTTKPRITTTATSARR